MKIITAPEHYDPISTDILVFLAGGITNCENWQKECIKQLEERYHGTDNLVVFNPRRENFPINDPSASLQQIQWEFDAIERCDIFSMYFCSGESDQPICMYELGRNILRIQNRFPLDWEKRIVISVERGYKRKQDVLIQTDLATNNKLYINTQYSKEICLAEHIENICNAFSRLKQN